MTSLPARSAAAWLGVASALAVLVYWVGLSGPLLLDDAVNLARLRDWQAGHATLTEALRSGSGMFGRPVAMATLALSAALGGFSPFAFKLGNLLTHLVCGVFIYSLTRRIAGRDPGLGRRASAVGLAVAALWLLHPLHASTVLYVVQRMAQVSALTVLGGMWLYMAARESLERRPSAGPVIALFAGIPLLTLIAFLAKENGVLLPLLCLVLEIGCFQAHPRAIKGFFGLTLLLPLAVGGALFALDPARLLGGYVRRDFDWQERLLSQARALCDYLAQIAVPNPSRMGIYTDDFPASTGLLSPPSTLLALLLLAGITVAAWRLRPRLPFLFVGWGIFLAGHALESGIVPLELYFEHRNYLPMLGVLYALVGLASMAIARLDEKGYRAGRLGAAAAVCVLAVFAFATHGRARTWRTQQALAEASVAAHPQSMRAWLAVVSDAIDRRDYARARSALGAMTRLEQPRARAQGYLNRVNLDCALAHAASASDIRNAVAARPARVTKDESETFDLLDRNTQVPCAGISNRALAGAAATFADAAATQPDSLGAKAELRHAAARFYAREGDWPAALKQAELAWQPGMPAAASVLLVQAQLAAGDLAGAERTWRQATRRARPGDEAGLRWLQKQIEAARDRAREGQAPP